jgi:hypothetical protein
VPGTTLVTTLDPYLQFEAERLLGDRDEASGTPRAATVIVMDPWSGEIARGRERPRLRSESLRAASTDDAWRDRAVSDAYEPGSTFKLITAAAALESGKASRCQRALSGARPARSRSAGTSSTTPRTASWPARERDRSKTSSRTRTTSARPRSACAIGKRAMYDDDRAVRLRRRRRTSSLPARTPASSRRSTIGAEVRSLRRSRSATGSRLTPLALIRAYAAIANGGMLMRPRIVHALEDAERQDDLHLPARDRAPRDQRGDGRDRCAASCARSSCAAPAIPPRRSPAIRPPARPERRKSSRTALRARRLRRSFIGMIPADRRATSSWSRSSARAARITAASSPRRCSPNSPGRRCSMRGSCRQRRRRAWSGPAERRRATRDDATERTETRLLGADERAAHRRRRCPPAVIDAIASDSRAGAPGSALRRAARRNASTGTPMSRMRSRAARRSSSSSASSTSTCRRSSSPTRASPHRARPTRSTITPRRR